MKPPASNVHVPEMIRCPLEKPEPCGGCGEPAWNAYRDGPWHPCCRVWAAELRAGRRCQGCLAAEGRPRAKPQRAEDDSDAYEMLGWSPSDEPTVFCSVPGCGLTGDPCWAHAVTDTTTDHGRLH